MNALFGAVGRAGAAGAPWGEAAASSRPARESELGRGAGGVTIGRSETKGAKFGVCVPVDEFAAGAWL
jgi:hypothetical protein